MTTKKEIHDNGYHRGWDVASWQDLPEIGQETEKHIDYQGIEKIEDKDEACDYFMTLAYEAETNSRQYSPFEFTAKELNELAELKPYDPWEIFEEGIRKGIEANWKQRSKDYYPKEKKVKKEVSTSERTDMMLKCIEVYKSVGYREINDFPNEYVLMINESTTEKVRLYYNGRIWEYK